MVGENKAQLRKIEYQLGNSAWTCTCIIASGIGVKAAQQISGHIHVLPSSSYVHLNIECPLHPTKFKMTSFT